MLWAGRGNYCGGPARLTATMGVALMVPMTFSMNATSGLVMLGAIYIGAIYGGSNSACLICTPGTPSVAFTSGTAGPFPRQARQTPPCMLPPFLCFGGVGGSFIFAAGSQTLAMFALNFQGPESFWLCIFGLSTIAVMSTGNMLKGLFYILGLLIATIGIDLLDVPPGLPLALPLVAFEVIPAMIGLFSFSQVLVLVASATTLQF